MLKYDLTAKFVQAENLYSILLNIVSQIYAIDNTCAK